MASTKTEVNSTWTAPRTWTAGELVTASMMNGLRDQINAVKTPAWASAYIDEASNYTTSSTSFTDVDGAGDALTLTVVTGGGNLWVDFSGVASCTQTYLMYLNLSVDGVDIVDDGILAVYSGAPNPINMSFSRLITGLSAGSHTIILRFKVSNASATMTLYAGAGTANIDTHPQLNLIEV